MTTVICNLCSKRIKTAILQREEVVNIDKMDVNGHFWITYQRKTPDNTFLCPKCKGVIHGHGMKLPAVTAITPKAK